MSILEFEDKGGEEMGKGFYDTLKNYANNSANDKLAKEQEAKVKNPNVEVK